MVARTLANTVMYQVLQCQETVPVFVLLCDYHALEFLLSFSVANKIEPEAYF